MPLQSNIAILFFSRHAEQEGYARSFAPSLSRKHNRQLAQAAIRHTQKVMQESGLPCIHVDHEMQRGATFGQRFAHAFEHVFGLGYDKVIAIGNDCLSLTANDIRCAANALQNGRDAILGPAKDGGAYLIGIARKSFDPASFAALPWQTDRVAAQLDGLFEQVAWLGEKEDVDHIQALRSVLSHFHTSSLKSLIQSLLASWQDWIINKPYQAIPALQPSYKQLRAPPFA